jgi:hypothetical protein
MICDFCSDVDMPFAVLKLSSIILVLFFIFFLVFIIIAVKIYSSINHLLHEKSFPFLCINRIRNICYYLDFPNHRKGTHIDLFFLLNEEEF